VLRLVQSFKPSERSGTTGASIQAAIELYKTTGEVAYKDFAVEKAVS
jgi:hypothetical protein